MKIFNRELALHLGVTHMNKCNKCGRVVCISRSESDTIVCTPIGVLYVSKVKQVDAAGRRVQETRP
jgi:hypothetical protein